MDMNALLQYPNLLYWALPLAAALLIVFVVTIVWWRKTAMRRRVTKALKAVAQDYLSDVVLPDGLDGHIHIDYLVLTGAGILVLDIKDVPGAIFGAPKMDQWAVMQGNHRFTFRNPLGPLAERIGAVKALAPNTDVQGYVIFTPRGSFPKGLPESALTLELLVEQFAPANPAPPAGIPDYWVNLRAQAQSHSAYQA